MAGIPSSLVSSGYQNQNTQMGSEVNDADFQNIMNQKMTDFVADISDGTIDDYDTLDVLVDNSERVEVLNSKLKNDVDFMVQPSFEDTINKTNLDDADKDLIFDVISNIGDTVKGLDQESLGKVLGELIGSIPLLRSQ